MIHLRDQYLDQNKDEFMDNEENKYHSKNGTSSNNHNNNIVVTNYNQIDEINNNNLLTSNNQKNNLNNNISDENFSNNKNFQKFEENNEINKNSNEQTLNNNENADKNFLINKSNSENNNINLNLQPQTLNNSKNNDKKFLHINGNNLDLNPQTLNNNKNDVNLIEYNNNNNNYTSEYLSPNKSDNNFLHNKYNNILSTENNILPNNDDILYDKNNILNNINPINQNNISNNNSPNIDNSNFNSFHSTNDTNNIWINNNDNILPISSYNDIDRVLDYNKDQFITPNVNNRRSNIKTLTIKGDTSDNQNISNNNPTKIKDILAHNRLYVSTKKPKIKFKRASINLDNNSIDIALINKNKNNNNHFTSHKTIYKRKHYATSKYFYKYKKHIPVFKKQKFIGNINYEIPKTYFQAINSKNKRYWIKAINDELNNLYSNNIMSFVKYVPSNKTVITTRWVFTIKTDSEGKIIKFKARLVARGFNQKFGIDFYLTFSPTLNIDCLKLIFAIASKFKWYVHQMDIKAAYLNADLDYDIYVTIPPGDANFRRGYWKLNKALYGLKQSGRQWYITLCNFLIENGFTQLKSESCIFKKVDKNKKLVCIIGIYVDDMIITGYDSEIKNIVNKIKERFKTSKSGPVDYILGIKVENNNNIYTLSQINFINTILNKFNINNTRQVNTPCVGDNIKSENKNPFDSTKYKSAIGMLIFLAKCTRPDIAYAVNKAARYSEHPTISDWNKVVNILKYLNSNKNYKITYDGKGDIIAYTDSDFAGDINDRKSTSGNIVLMGRNPICWNSKKQTVVATSTAEAEYISASLCIKKILWIKNVLFELLNFKKPITIYTDNKASKISMENGDLNPKLKHISIKYHFNVDNIRKNIIKLNYINSENMLADILTKFSNSNKIKSFANQVFNNKN